MCNLHKNHAKISTPCQKKHFRKIRSISRKPSGSFLLFVRFLPFLPVIAFSAFFDIYRFPQSSEFPLQALTEAPTEVPTEAPTEALRIPPCAHGKAPGACTPHAPHGGRSRAHRSSPRGRPRRLCSGSDQNRFHASFVRSASRTERSASKQPCTSPLSSASDGKAAALSPSPLRRCGDTALRRCKVLPSTAKSTTRAATVSFGNRHGSEESRHRMQEAPRRIRFTEAPSARGKAYGRQASRKKRGRKSKKCAAQSGILRDKSRRSATLSLFLLYSLGLVVFMAFFDPFFPPHPVYRVQKAAEPISESNSEISPAAKIHIRIPSAQAAYTPPFRPRC